MKTAWIGSIIIVSQIGMAQAQSNLTDDMKNFIALAKDKNGDQKGFDRNDAEKFLHITFNKKGARYDSTKHLPDNPDQPVFEYATNKGQRYLTFYFTEPIKEFKQAIEKFSGYKNAWFDRQQANGLPVDYFIGQNPSEYIQTRKLWIRIYECSFKPQDICLRKAQLIFGNKI